ncbi:hypothetical protein ACA910_020852 [Epithemia clementina (nom. ined.)]
MAKIGIETWSETCLRVWWTRAVTKLMCKSSEKILSQLARIVVETWRLQRWCSFLPPSNSKEKSTANDAFDIGLRS